MTWLSQSIRDQLSEHAELADRSPTWPAAAWSALKQAGVLQWSIPREYGGLGLQPVELLIGMEEIANCCLTTAFALSQREAAVRQLLKGPHHLRSRYLPQLAAGDLFMTVGLSQLTTSRQHQAPALRATPLSSGGYQLDGEIPWVTGADQAAAIVVGATLPDRRQLLVVLRTSSPGVMIEAPLTLAALVGSRTSLVKCDGVEISPDEILAGPADSVLGHVGGGGLETSCLAIGLASAAIRFIQDEARSRADLQDAALRLDAAWHLARTRLHTLATAAPDPDGTLALRQAATLLALRSTQASLMVAKGVGFVVPHPVQRWIRQAGFFLVWSCPRPVAAGVLAELAACQAD